MPVHNVIIVNDFIFSSNIFYYSLLDGFYTFSTLLDGFYTFLHSETGVYILENTLPPGGISVYVIKGKNEKGNRKG
jgi:hypothetical protein